MHLKRFEFIDMWDGIMYFFFLSWFGTVWTFFSHSFIFGYVSISE